MDIADFKMHKKYFEISQKEWIDILKNNKTRFINTFCKRVRLQHLTLILKTTLLHKNKLLPNHVNAEVFHRISTALFLSQNNIYSNKQEWSDKISRQVITNNLLQSRLIRDVIKLILSHKVFANCVSFVLTILLTIVVKILLW